MSSNDKFNSNLNLWIKEMENLKKLVPNATSKLAPKISKLISTQVSNATDPDGKTWKKDKDGRQPLVGIDQYVSVIALKESVKVNLSEPATYHQTGSKTLPQRKIIPDNSIPTSWSNAINEVIEDEFKKVANGNH